MATEEETLQALRDAIKVLAEAAAEDGTSATQLQVIAAAARDLAEATALLNGRVEPVPGARTAVVRRDRTR